MRPVIGITASVSDDRLSYMQKHAYARAIESAGGLPLILPPSFDVSLIDQTLSLLNGLLLAGGDDIDPALYGEARLPECGLVTPIRDVWELPLCRAALDRRMPVLGICRGVQVMNVALGGTLYQDLQSQRPTALHHAQQEPPEEVTHDVTLIPGSKLADVLGVPRLRVNSHHHQALKDLAPGLTAVSYALDGLIEGAEMPGHPFFLGVQWHPERLWEGTNAAHSRLFQAFVHACAPSDLS